MSRLVVYLNWRDFRVSDNPALTAASATAAQSGTQFLAGYINDTSMYEGQRLTHNHNLDYILSRVLPQFADSFQSYYFFDQSIESLLEELSKEHQVELYLNEVVEPKWQSFYKSFKTNYPKINLHLLPDQMTVDRMTVTGTGKLYSVFTPFMKSVRASFESAPVISPAKNIDKLNYLEYDSKKSLKIEQESEQDILDKLSNRSEWRMHIQSHYSDYQQSVRLDYLKDALDRSKWVYSEEDAQAVFISFLDRIGEYKDARNMMDLDGVSRVSQALAFGLISARQLTQYILGHKDCDSSGSYHYISELIWREFYKYIIYHKPSVVDKEFRDKFRDKQSLWVDNELAWSRYSAWCRGETGCEIVDAAMVELNRTGWMHNRSRMIAASFLTKNLGVDWRWGQEYFRAALIDLDEGSNNGGWQWAGSVGADPKPMRIFNPYIQQEKFDPDRKYITKYLGNRDKIAEIVDYKQSRADAMERYKS